MVRATSKNKQTIGTVRWIFEAWKIPRRSPPIGSNRELALALLRFLVLVALVLSGCMAILGFAIPDISSVSIAVAVIFFFFTGHLYLFWHRLPLTWIRAAVLIALGFFVLRWVGALHFLPPEEIPTAMLSSLVYIPMLLIVIGLMEGQRRGVAIGLLVSLGMGISLTVASSRPASQITAASRALADCSLPGTPRTGAEVEPPDPDAGR